MDYAVSTALNTTASWPDLSPKQRQFVERYVVENNASKAARDAGYASRSSHTTAYRLLRNPKVRARIDELRAELAAKHDATVDNVINRYRQIAMTDAPSLLIQDQGSHKRHRFKHPDELSEDQRAAISEIKVKHEDGKQVFEYKLYNAKEALDSLGRVLGIFKDRLQLEEREQVRILFEEIAAHPERGNTIAMLNARTRQEKQTCTLDPDFKGAAHCPPQHVTSPHACQTTTSVGPKTGYSVVGARPSATNQAKSEESQ